MPIIDFPPTFDFDYVKNIYPEFKLLNDDTLAQYCEKTIVEQGRSTCSYDRREALKTSLQDMIDRYHAKVLEISPWDNPFFHGESVKYFDVADSETLRKDLNKAYRTSGNVPEKIHFVSPNCDLGVVGEKFDIVFSAHVIEHVPDLVAHFQAVSKILNAGGLYVLIIPDKRFCFDHYNAESTIAEVIDAFFNERKNSGLASSSIRLTLLRTTHLSRIGWVFTVSVLDKDKGIPELGDVLPIWASIFLPKDFGMTATACAKKNFCT